MSFPSSLAFLLLSVPVFLVLSAALATSRKPLPPGPRLGWFASEKLPQSHQWLTYAKWQHTYGIGDPTSPHQF